VRATAQSAQRDAFLGSPAKVPRRSAPPGEFVL